MINTVIFDMDGLLVDSEIIVYQLYGGLLETYGKHISIEEYIHEYSGKTAVGNMRTLISKYSLPISVEDGLAFMTLKERGYLEKGIALKKGAHLLLAYLKKRRYKIVLATSSTTERALHILCRNGVASFFDKMVFGTDVKRGKPYPDIFLKACACAGETSENCLVLEDSEAGVQAAYATGVDVICIPDMKKPGAEIHKLAAAELASLEDVIPWLEKDKIQMRLT